MLACRDASIRSIAAHELKAIFASLIMICVAINIFVPVAYGESQCAYVFLTPPAHVAQQIGEIFNIKVNISNVDNLHSCELIISYNTSLLDVVEVIKSDFFPQEAVFAYVKNESSGLVMVSLTLPELSVPLGGHGTLISIAFEATHSSGGCIPPGILRLEHTSLCNPSGEEIDHQCSSALYFWRTLLPDPPGSGALLDLFTQLGGKGSDCFGGTFEIEQLVELTSNITYNEWPEQNKLVAFQIINPSNQTVAILITETDEMGFAKTNFRVPQIPESFGLWRAISTVDVAEVVVWDTICFWVTRAVGGNSFQLEGSMVEECLSARPGFYLSLVAALTIAFVFSKKIKIRGAHERAR